MCQKKAYYNLTCLWLRPSQLIGNTCKQSARLYKMTVNIEIDVSILPILGPCRGPIAAGDTVIFLWSWIYKVPGIWCSSKRIFYKLRQLAYGERGEGMPIMAMSHDTRLTIEETKDTQDAPVKTFCRLCASAHTQTEPLSVRCIQFWASQKLSPT